MGIPYVRVNRDDCTILGDALIAGNAVGIYPDLKQTAQRFTQKTKEYTPDPHRHEYYQRYVEVYESVFDKVRDIFVELKDIPRFSESE
jgi:xylulokinase